MKPKYIPAAETPESMDAIGGNRWYARARVRMRRPDQPDTVIRLAGEWHGKTPEEAESRALRAASDWIAARDAK
jgi:hypothetical protein